MYRTREHRDMQECVLSEDCNSKKEKVDNPMLRESVTTERPLMPGECVCEECGEPCDTANVEAYEMSGKIVCDDCSDTILDDNGQFGVGA